MASSVVPTFTTLLPEMMTSNDGMLASVHLRRQTDIRDIRLARQHSALPFARRPAT